MINSKHNIRNLTARDWNVFREILSPIIRDHMKWSRDGSLANQISQLCLHILLHFEKSFKNDRPLLLFNVNHKLFYLNK
jgi:hypothetical protein